MTLYPRLFIAIFLLALSFNSSAQKNKTVYVEAFGNAYLAASINYDMRFGSGETGLGVRIGWDLAGSGTLPILGNVILGSGAHKLELGVGTVFFTQRVEHAGFQAEGVRLTGTVGYRYYAESGFTAMIGWTPIAADDGSSLVWFGMGFGWRF